MIKKKTLIILVSILAVLAVALTAWYIAFDKKQDKVDRTKTLESTETTIYSFPTYEISKLSVTNSDGTFNFNTEDFNNWTLEDSEFLIDNDQPVLIVQNLANLISKSTITENATDLSLYGLDNPSVLTATDINGNSYSVELGTKTTTKDGYYLRKPDSLVVYKVTNTVGEVFSTTKDEFRNLYLFPVSERKIDQVSLQAEGEYIFDATYASGVGWTIKKPIPIDWQGDLTAFSNVTIATVRAKAVNFMEIDKEGKNLANYGLDNPFATFYAKTNEGKTVTAIFSHLNEQTQKVYCYIPENGYILDFLGQDVAFLWTQTIEVVNYAVHTENSINKVKSVTITYDGKTEKIDVSDGSEMDFSVNGEKIIRADIKKMLYNLHISLLEVDLDTFDLSQTPPADATPFVTVTYEYNSSDPPLTLSYIPKDETNFYIVQNDQFLGFTTRLKEFEQPGRFLECWQLLVDNNVW